MTQIVDFEVRNIGVDLNGWRYERVVSEASGAAYYYYHLASKRPDAPKLVLIHGLFLDGRNFLRFNSLSEHFELLALELPHQSPFYKGRLKDFTELLQDFIDAVGFDCIYLSGISLGGMIAMTYAGDAPKTEIQALFLISTDAAKTTADLEKQQRSARRMLKITGDRDDMTICLVDEFRRRRMAAALPEELEVMKLFSLKHPAFYRQILHIADNMEAVLPIKKITAPTLVIHGDADKSIPFNSAKHLVDVIPNATLKVIAGGGHDIAYTRADEVVSLIARYVSAST